MLRKMMMVAAAVAALSLVATDGFARGGGGGGGGHGFGGGFGGTHNMGGGLGGAHMGGLGRTPGFAGPHVTAAAHSNRGEFGARSHHAHFRHGYGWPGYNYACDYDYYSPGYNPSDCASPYYEW
jgi:hypothetical protein